MESTFFKPAKTMTVVACFTGPRFPAYSMCKAYGRVKSIDERANGERSTNSPVPLLSRTGDLPGLNSELDLAVAPIPTRPGYPIGQLRTVVAEAMEDRITASHETVEIR